MIDRFDFGLGLKIVRMDIDATGKGTLTWSYTRRRATVHPVSAEVVAAFDAALTSSSFPGADVRKVERVACTDDETIFEAVVGGRYKVVIEPCGDEAGLDRAMAVLDNES